MLPPSSDEEARIHIMSEWRGLALKLTTDKAEELLTNEAVGGVVHHGRLRGSGIARSEDGRLTLLISGTYWFEDANLRLATPAECLQHIAAHGLPDRQTLKGNYAFVLVNATDNLLVAENDPFGVIPLYYVVADTGVIIGSDIKYLRHSVRPRLCKDSVEEYLTVGYIASELTLLEGVKRLPPGSRFRLHGGHIRVSSFGLPSFPRNKLPDDTYYAELSLLFERAIARCRDDVGRLSVSLSGGIDSRIVLLAARKLGFELEASSVGEPRSLECAVAQDFCAKVGVPIIVHQNVGERFASWFDQAVWTTESRCQPGHVHFLDALFAGHYRAAPQLHGFIGDVVMGGDYDMEHEVPRDKVALTAYCQRSMQSIIYWRDGSWKDLGFNSWIDFRRVKERLNESFLARCPQDDPYSTFLWTRYQFRVFGFITPCLMSQVTPWTDVIAPYIDPAVFAHCASISTSAILNRRAQLYWGMNRYPQLNLSPRVKDGVQIPFSSLNPGDYAGGMRKLQRLHKLRYLTCRLSAGRINPPYPETYPLYGAWFRRSEAVRRFFTERLLSEQSLDRGLWRREGIKRLLHDLRVGRDQWDALATILMIETFARLFVDESLKPQTHLCAPKNFD